MRLLSDIITTDLAESMARLRATRDERASAVKEPPTPWPEPERIKEDHITVYQGEYGEVWDAVKAKTVRAKPYRQCPYCQSDSCPMCETVVDRADAIGRAHIPWSKAECTLRVYQWDRLKSDEARQHAMAFARVFEPLARGQRGGALLASKAQEGKREGKHRREWDWGAMFYGPPGTGKSHLAAGFAREACIRGYSARYNYWPDVIKSYRAIQHANSGVSEFDFIERLTRGNLIVLDEVRFDMGGKSDYKSQLLLTLLESIQSNGGKLVMSTNFTAAELASPAGDHIVSRMRGLMPFIECQARDGREVGGW